MQVKKQQLEPNMEHTGSKLETACILSIVKQIKSPGWMHETSARDWCTGKTQRDQVEGELASN